jgi:hypothetical protein
VAEQVTVNHLVAGSNPARAAMILLIDIFMRQEAESRRAGLITWSFFGGSTARQVAFLPAHDRNVLQALATIFY